MKKLIGKILGVGLLTIPIATQLRAQDEKFNIGGEVRPRAELRNGLKKPITNGTDPAFFVEQRTRLNFNYSDKKFDAVVMFQDVRIWGSTSQIYKTDPSLDNMYQAYGRFKLTPKLAIAAGRMELNYDNARFLGNLGWAQQGRSHDLALFTFKDSAFQLHIGAAFNQDAATPEFKKLTTNYYSGVANYKTMQFLWLHKEIGKYKISLLALNNGMQWGTKADSSGIRHSQTYGLFAAKKAGVVKATLEAYTHAGEDVSGKLMNGYFLGASATYAKMKKLPLTVGGDYMSGTKSGSGNNSAFNPMYGTNHKFYGFMDYFYVGNGHSNAGLVDLYFKTKIGISEKTKLVIALHNFDTAVKVPNPTNTNKTMSSRLGQEVDLVFIYNASKKVNFKIGYSQMFKTSTLEATKAVYGANTSKTNAWAWAMITFKPTFLSK